MDMKRILQAMDGVTTKPVEGGSDMSKFLSIIKTNDVSILNEGANPHKVSLPVQMAMQHYQEVDKPRVLGKKESVLKKYVAEAEAAAEERAEEKRSYYKQYAKVIAERVMMKEGLTEFAQDRFSDDDENQGSWNDFIQAFDPEIKKLGFGMDKRSSHDARIYAHPEAQKGIMVRQHPERDNVYFKLFRFFNQGEDEVGLADLSQNGAASVLVKVEDFLSGDQGVSEIAGAFPSPSTRAKWAADAAASNRAEAARQAELQRQANAADAAKLSVNTADVDRLNKVNYSGANAPKPSNASWDGDSDFLDIDGTKYNRAMRMPISGDVPPDMKLIVTKEGRQVYLWTRNSLKGVAGRYFYPAEKPNTIQQEGWTKLPSGDYQNSHTGVRTSKPPVKKKRSEKTGAEWDAIEKAKKEQGVAENSIEHQHGDTKPWAYWGSPERVAQKLYKIYGGEPIGKDEVKHLWKVDGPDRMTKFMLKPDLHAILSNYQAMSTPGELLEGTIERRINRQQQLITSYTDRAKMTKNPIKKQHYLAMADQLASELDSMINDYNEHERASNEIGRHDEEPISMWEAQSAAAKLQKAYEREQQRSEAERKRGQALLNTPQKTEKKTNENFNKPDSVKMDVPLLIRIMEFAREDAQTDMDLHDVAEQLIRLSEQGVVLTMDNYDEIVGHLSESGFIKPKKKTSTCRAGQVQTGMQSKDGKLVPKCSVK